MKERSILLVGDDSVLRETLAEILRFEGYLVETTEANADALATAERGDPALLLVDLETPASQDRQFTARLSGWRASVPIVAMTCDREQRRAADKIGAACLIAKPLKLGDLLPTIERLCHNGGAVIHR